MSLIFSTFRLFFYSGLLGSEVNKGLYGWEVNPNQWGIVTNFGIRLGRFIVSAYSLFQQSESFGNPEGSTLAIPAPKAFNNRSGCSLVFLF